MTTKTLLVSLTLLFAAAACGEDQQQRPPVNITTLDATQLGEHCVLATDEDKIIVICDISSLAPGVTPTHVECHHQDQL